MVQPVQPSAIETHVFEAHLLEAARGERRAMAAAAIEYELARAVGEPRIALRVLEIRTDLEETAWVVARARQMAGFPFVRFAHVDEFVAAAVRRFEQPVHLVRCGFPHGGEGFANEIG